MQLTTVFTDSMTMSKVGLNTTHLVERELICSCVC